MAEAAVAQTSLAGGVDWGDLDRQILEGPAGDGQIAQSEGLFNGLHNCTAVMCTISR